MKNPKISSISLLLILFMLIGMLSACNNGPETTEAPEQSSTEAVSEDKNTAETSESSETVTETVEKGSETVGSSAESTAFTEVRNEETDAESDTVTHNTDIPESSHDESESTEISETLSETSSEAQSETSSEAQNETSSEALSESMGETQSETLSETQGVTEETELVGPVLKNEHTEVIENAHSYANGVQSYYNADRSHYIVENKNITLDYRLSGSDKPMLESLKNSKGQAYLADTMDVYVTTTGGKTYYASNSIEKARVNIYRLGYYYYDVHILEQDFISSTTVENSFNIPIESFTGYKDVSTPVINNGELTSTITNQEDPQIYAATDSAASEFNYLQFSYKGKSVGAITVYVIAGNKTSHNEEQSFVVEVTSDGSWHTYTVPLNNDTIQGYTGQIKGIRFDFGGAVNTSIAIKDVAFKQINVDSIPLSLDRVFHTFPDKLHQEIHVVAYKNTTNIDEIGVEYKIPWDSVEKIVAKDASGLVYELKDVDWATAEYLAVDVKDIGIIGFILPYDAEDYQLKASKKHGNLLIEMIGTPENGTILAPTNSTVNDYRMGCRIYTDETHDFAAFIEEAYCERNPLTSENIVIDAEKFVRGAKFKGYDGIRGVYHITLKGAAGFNDPYYDNQNLHYNASFSIKGDDHDRSLYMMTFTSSGTLECATIMDENNQLLPIPLQVSKNFSEKEEPFYNCGDATYGETFFPIVLNANDEQYYTVLNIYQNWGNYPLKQISSIGYYMPYYHLSTGVTESNCISPWYNRGKNLWTLPDHRPASMPKSSDLKNMYKQYGNQPQTPNAGLHYFLQYTDADGIYVSSEYVDNYISSYGPTYADITMNYLSDDGKIKISYRHVEMPQPDENRAYYEMTYEVLDTVVIDDFLQDFSFYTMTGFLNYERVGYLDKNNTPQANKVNESSAKPKKYILGDQCPYFSLFYCSRLKEYANLSFLIYDSEFIIGGEEVTDASFAIVDHNYAVRLTLDLDKVTLNAGDKFTINCIIMPWGGGYIQDDGTQYHALDDKNVQNVRLNTMLNPFKATAVENCTTVDSWFLPEVVTTNGKDATFTVSGGCDIDPNAPDAVNVTVRADGFYTLTRPKVEVLEGDNWVTYELSSVNTLDASGRGVDYDGYQIHYNDDGTYSYSFVITVTDGVSRTFRITVE